jgi:hypothetical protein
MVVVVDVIVRRGKGYIPTQGQTEAGFYIGIEPVYTVNLNVEDVLGAFEQVIAAGHPRVPTPTQEEWRTREDPILKAAGVRSWKRLAQGGASYTIDWQEDTVALYVSRLDHKGRFEVDPAKTRTFPKTTPLRIIVEVILDDVRSRPELLETDSG